MTRRGAKLPPDPRRDFPGLLAWISWYFNADPDWLRGELERVATERVAELAKPRPSDASKLVRLTCSRRGCGRTIDVVEDPDRAAAQMNVAGWISTDDERLVCSRCVPRAMRAGLA